MARRSDELLMAVRITVPTWVGVVNKDDALLSEWCQYPRIPDHDFCITGIVRLSCISYYLRLQKRSENKGEGESERLTRLGKARARGNAKASRFQFSIRAHRRSSNQQRRSDSSDVASTT